MSAAAPGSLAPDPPAASPTQASRSSLPARPWRRIPSGELLMNLTMRDIRSQFKRTALGRVWSLINPLSTIAIFWFVFGVVFQMPPPQGNVSGLHNYALFLTSGVIPWTFIAVAITTGMSSLVANTGLLQKVYFPRYVLVVASVMALGSTLLIELGVVTLIMLLAGGWQVLIFIPGVLVLSVVTAAFCIGVALMLSIAQVYFRDTEHFVAIFMQIWFYGSAIIYPFEQVLSKLQDASNHVLVFGHPLSLSFLFRLNPVYRIINSYRAMLYDFELPRWSDAVGSVAWALLVLGVGIMVFRRFAPRLVEEL